MSGLITRQIGDVLVADFTDSAILDQDKLAAVGAQLRGLPNLSESQKILVDMRRVGLVTSSMIGEFIKLRQACDEANIELKLCSLSKELLTLFKKMKLNKLFSVYPSRERALKAFGVKQ